MKLQMSSNVREIELSLQTAGNDELARPPLPTLPLPLYPAPPSPSYHCVPVERKDGRVSSEWVPVRTLIDPLFLNSLQ